MQYLYLQMLRKIMILLLFVLKNEMNEIYLLLQMA